MRKPEGYDQARAAGGSMTLPAGGYICQILSAYEDTSKNGAQMLVLQFDICEGDYADFYASKFNAASIRNPQTKWPGTVYQLTEGNSLPFFKAMITAIEESNPGYTWNWNERALKGKKFGGVFRREEVELDNGEIVMTTKMCAIRSVKAIRAGIKTPPDKLLNKGNGRDFYANNSRGSMTEDDLPF